jgi:PAS domain-containing protein
MGSQKEIEIILSRQLASYLSIPIFIVDTKGDLLFYNESAEPVLGRRFEETGSLSIDEWSKLFELTDVERKPIPPEESPLVIALRDRRPVHRQMWLCGLDNIERMVQATCLPIVGQADRFLGAIAFFWETEEG